MPRTEIPVTEISRAGVAPVTATNADMTNGMYVDANNGRIWLEIVSTEGAASRTVGFEFPGDVDGVAITDKIVTVAAGTTKLAGPFPKGTYNQGEDSDIPDALYINPSVDGATIKLRAYQLTSD